MELQAGRLRVVLDAAAGGRLASLQVDGRELLVTGPTDDPLAWGCYPMAPWVGRLRHGRFALGGVEHQVPVDLAPHAIHGLGYRRPWVAIGDGRVGLDLADAWDLGGRVEHRMSVDEGAVRLELTFTAAQYPVPVMLGWHPWFRRVLDDGAVVSVVVDPTGAYEVGDDAIPTGRRVDPPPHPWDHCVAGLRADPVLTWGDGVQVTLRSSCDLWQVYEPDHAICIEPQTGVPDQFNRDPQILHPGESTEAWFELGLG